MSFTLQVTVSGPDIEILETTKNLSAEEDRIMYVTKLALKEMASEYMIVLDLLERFEPLQIEGERFDENGDLVETLL